jgi:hypothetical protein
VKVAAAVARLDLTASAVWRRAMHELIGQRSPGQLVDEFAEAQRLEKRVGRPKR